jgi:methionine synthase II (cobalamin-independent)
VDLKEQLMNRAMMMMQNPKVMKAMQNPKVMQTVTGAIQMRAKLQQDMDAQIEKVAKTLKLATRSEVRELKRALTKLEGELQQKQQQGNAAE